MTPNVLLASGLLDYLSGITFTGELETVIIKKQ